MRRRNEHGRYGRGGERLAAVAGRIMRGDRRECGRFAAAAGGGFDVQFAAWRRRKADTRRACGGETDRNVIARAVHDAGLPAVARHSVLEIDGSRAGGCAEIPDYWMKWFVL